MFARKGPCFAGAVSQQTSIYRRKLMKKRVLFPVFCVVLSVLGGCASTPQVSRVDSGTVMDLSGYWNDSDAGSSAMVLSRIVLILPE
jgi:hypothetical protein